MTFLYALAAVILAGTPAGPVPSEGQVPGTRKLNLSSISKATDVASLRRALAKTGLYFSEQALKNGGASYLFVAIDEGSGGYRITGLLYQVRAAPKLILEIPAPSDCIALTAKVTASDTITIFAQFKKAPGKPQTIARVYVAKAD